MAIRSDPTLELLIVDDDVLVRTALRRLLRCAITFADSIAAAMALVEAGRRFDVILCDVLLDHECGLDFLEWLAQRHPALVERVAFITAGVSGEDLRDRVGATRRPVLTKPFTVAQAWSVIDAVRAPVSTG